MSIFRRTKKPEPSGCPCGGSSGLAHAGAPRYFSGYVRGADIGVIVQRTTCLDCGTIVRLFRKPKNEAWTVF